MMESTEIVQESLEFILGPSFIDSPNFTPPTNTVTPLTQFSTGAVIDIKKDFLTSSLPFGCIISPFATPHSPLPILRRSISACVDCSALLNCYSRVIIEDSKLKWNCIFCGKTNLFPPIGRDIKDFKRSDFSELYVQEFEYIDPLNQPIYNVSQHFEQTMIYVIDANITQSEMSNLRNSIFHSLESIPEKSNICIITFSSVVQIFELGLAGISSSEVYTGSRSPNATEIESIKNKTSRFLIPLKLCRNNINGIFDYLIHSAKMEQVPSRTIQHRSFGTAVELALTLIQEDKGKEVHGRIENSAGGQIVCFLNGFPNYGPGSFDSTEKMGEEYSNEEAELFYKKHAKICFKFNFSINLFCIGLRNFHVKQLQSLVLTNGGSILLFKDYNDPNLYDSLAKVITSHGGQNGAFTIHSSTDITIAHIIGPAVSSQSIVNNEGDSTTLCVTSSVNPRHSYAIYFKLKGNIIYDHVYFQFIVKFTNIRNESVSRVFTYKIIATRSKATYLNNVVPDITAVLLAKKYILKARKTPQNKSRTVVAKLDKTLGQIIKNCSDKRNQDTLYGIAPSLAILPRLVYFIRRSPMLGSILQHSDEIDYLRCLFLQADEEVSRRLIEPSLFLVEEDNIKLLPLENLVLQSHHVLLLDHQTNIFTWYGSDAAEKYKLLKNKCDEMVTELSRDRFPKPSVMTFKEGTSMARWLEARLIPSHKDTKSQQLYSYPEFGNLSEIERTKLLAKFYHTDDLTFFQYLYTLQKQFKF